jgi:signal transduction histidine kinase
MTQTGKSWPPGNPRCVRRAGWSLAARLWLVLLAAIGLLVPNAPAEPPVNWRVYRGPEGLPYSVTTAVALGPDGGAVIRQGEENLLSFFDGYEVKQIPPSAQPLLVVQSGSPGTVWAQYRDGFMQYEHGRWIPLPVKEVAVAMQSTGRQQNLRWCSVQPNQVLFLVGDQLLEYDAVRRETTLVLRVEQTRLGSFLDLGAGGEGTVWLTGRDGVARLGPEFSSVNAESNTTSFVTPPTVPARNLRRPMRDEANGATMLADSAVDGHLLWARLAEGVWQTGMVPDSHTQRAWRMPDGMMWFLTPSALFHLAPGRTVEQEASLATQYWDVAVGEQGVFYVATSEGLLRYMPLPWQAPRGLEAEAMPYQFVREDSGNHLWCASDSMVMALADGAWKKYLLPGVDVGAPQISKRLVILPDGHVLYGFNNRLFGFSSARGGFEEILHPSGARLKLLGQLADGAAAVQVLMQAESETNYALAHYNGKEFRPLNGAGLKPALLGALNFLHTARNGDLWIGGASGLARFHGQKWGTFPQPDGGFSLVELEGGKMWFGGRNNIHQFDGKTWQVVQSGLDHINAMVQSRDGSIWVAVGNGLYRFYKNSWIYNAVREGLPTSTINDIFEDHGGQLWAATSLGVSLLHPALDLDPPRTILKLDIPNAHAPQNEASFTVQGRDRWRITQDVRLLFAYQLDGAAWTPYEKRTQIALHDLTPGHHQLRVRAMDVNGNEEANPTTLDFITPRPWYREPRLQIILAGAIALIVFFAGLAINRHRELARSYARVEVIVKQRTQELEQAQRELLHSQKMTALGTLTAGIAHDFNSILSVIKGSVQIIDKNLADPGKITSRTSRINTVIHQAESLLRAMLSYSRSEEPTTAECDLNAAVEESLLLLDESLLRDIKMGLAFDAGQPNVCGSPELVEQILSNLIINATDALARRGTIWLRTGQLSSAPAGLLLSPRSAPAYGFVAVEDQGCGIEPEILPRIFEPFFTRKALSKRHGTGLGLYMVFELSKNLGAGLRVESTPGRGSTFTLIIPMAGVSRPAGAATTAETGKQPASTSTPTHDE